MDVNQEKSAGKRRPGIAALFVLLAFLSVAAFFVVMLFGAFLAQGASLVDEWYAVMALFVGLAAGSVATAIVFVALKTRPLPVFAIPIVVVIIVTPVFWYLNRPKSAEEIAEQNQKIADEIMRKYEHESKATPVEVPKSP